MVWGEAGFILNSWPQTSTGHSTLLYNPTTVHTDIYCVPLTCDTKVQAARETAMKKKNRQQKWVNIPAKGEVVYINKPIKKTR